MAHRSTVAAVTLLVAVLLTGCSGSDKASAPRTTAPTPISRLDAATVRIARVPFCDRVPDSDVRRALGVKADAHESWGNGDPVPGETGTGEVGHEIGCSWTGSSGVAARAWVFARPVTGTFAGALVRQAGQQRGCTSEAATVFGNPALLQTCTQPDGVERVRRAGLFGDSWLTCEVAGPATSHPRGRLDRWCASTVAALDVR